MTLTMPMTLTKPMTMAMTLTLTMAMALTLTMPMSLPMQITLTMLMTSAKNNEHKFKNLDRKIILINYSCPSLIPPPPSLPIHVAFFTIAFLISILDRKFLSLNLKAVEN